MNLSIAAKFGLPAIALAALLVACPDPTPVVDTAAPTIVASSVTPTGTAVPVSTNKISVTFNEEMDPSVLTGVISFTLPATGAPSVSAPAWSNGNKTYSVTLSALTAPTSYKFKVAGTVKDKAGNKYVPGTSEYSFSTVVGGTGGNNATLNAANTSGYFKDTVGLKVGSPVGMRVGYTVAAGGAPDGIAKAFMSFTLPAGTTAAKITSAKLSLFNVPTVSEGATGDGTNLFAAGRTLNLESIVLAGAALGVADFETLGTAAGTVTSAAGLVNIDVTTAVKAAVAAGKVQFRLSMVAPTTAPAAGYWLRVGGGGAPAASQPTLVLNVAP
jgi:hypothetical protein